MDHTVRGFEFSATAAGIKHRAGAPDIALLAVDRPAAAAAVFTRNRVVAAPVIVSRDALARSGGQVRAVVVNSGNANACTGRRGLVDARRMAALTAGALAIERDQVIVASTGVIGVPLPMDRIEPAIPRAAQALAPGGFGRFARAILTTDRGPKTARRSLRIGGATCAIVGCTKGAGMIAPDMATTLTFVATDAPVRRRDLDPMLRDAVDGTYNAIVVDGDTSTNDMVLALASGAAGRRAPTRGELAAFGDALRDLLDELARKLMREGEGVHHVVDIAVTGARRAGDAREVARTIATSPLVKTAIAGGDANWGRILAAAGRAGVALRQDRLGLRIGGVQVVAAGTAVTAPGTERRAEAVMKRREYTIELDLGLGRHGATIVACDLSHEYVTINADYRT